MPKVSLSPSKTHGGICISSLQPSLNPFLSYLPACSLTGIITGMEATTLNQMDKFSCFQKLTFNWEQTISKLNKNFR